MLGGGIINNNEDRHKNDTRTSSINRERSHFMGVELLGNDKTCYNLIITSFKNEKAWVQSFGMKKE